MCAACKIYNALCNYHDRVNKGMKARRKTRAPRMAQGHTQHYILVTQYVNFREKIAMDSNNHCGFVINNNVQALRICSRTFCTIMHALVSNEPIQSPKVINVLNYKLATYRRLRQNRT